MQSPRIIDVKEIIDANPVSRFQLRILVLCGLVALFDGFDAQAIAFVASAMARDFGTSVTSFGPIFGAGTLGLTLGALALPPLGDRWGRRGPIMLSVLIFGLFSLATVWAHSFAALFALRFLTGLGVGAAVPCIIPLVSEYAPTRIRSALITIVTCSWPLGAVLGGAVSARVIPIWGWQAVFFLGGVLPLLLVVALWVGLPESIRFLVSRGGAPSRVAAILRKVAPGWSVTEDDHFVHSEVALRGFPVKHLFTGGRALMTILLWIPFFMNFLVLFFVFNWLPALLQQASLPMEKAVTATVLFNLGGVVGCLCLGRLMDRFGQCLVIAAAYALASASIGAIGVFDFSFTLMMVAVFVAGFCTVGAQACGNALVSGLYPTSIRTTAVGWAYGVGRIGSVVGPVVGGILLSLGWGMSGLFSIAALPLLCATIVMLFLSQVAPADADTRREARPVAA